MIIEIQPIIKSFHSNQRAGCMFVKLYIELKLFVSAQINILLWNVLAHTMRSIQCPPAEAGSGLHLITHQLHLILNQHEEGWFTFLWPDNEGLGDAVDQATITVDQVGHVLCGGERRCGDGERLDETRWTETQRRIHNESLSVKPSLSGAVTQIHC